MNKWFLAVQLLVCAIVASSNQGDPYGELCVVINPLRTRYISAWSEVPAAGGARGCAAAPSSTHEVHVVRLLNPTSSDVTLEIVDENVRSSRKIVLVLDSAQARVSWNLKAVNVDQRQQHNIIVTGDSSVEQSQFGASVSRRLSESRAALLRYVERRFKTLASVSQVSGANRLRLVLPQTNGSAAQSCDSSSNAVSPVLKAWRSKLLTLEGCFHAESIGLYPKDVHIIEVANGDDSSSAIEDVYLHLSSGDPEPSGSRDLVLILKAARPVRWILSSDQKLSGMLTIVSDQAVRNQGISAHQKLEVRSENMPDGFAMLILSATGQFGPPVSYVKTTAANRIQLTVTIHGKIGAYTPDSKVEVAASHSPPSMEMGVRSLDRGLGVHQSNKGGKRNAAAQLQQALQVDCGKSVMVAMLPRWLADSLGVTAVWLNDRSCAGLRNATSWNVETHVTSCGTTSSSNGKLTTYSNTLHVHLGTAREFSNDDEDFEGSGYDSDAETDTDSTSPSQRHVTLPIKCHYEPVFPIGFEGADDDNVLDPVDVSVGQIDLYHMEIHRAGKSTSALIGDSKETGEKEVAADEQLHVKAWIDGVPYIRMVMEKCWVSNSSDSNLPARLVLIQNTCPAHLSVHVLAPHPEATKGGFSFHVSKDYADMGRLYIHCKLGLCTNDINRSQGNLKLCVDQSQYCSGRHILKPFLEDSFSTAQQILVRGPLQLVNSLSAATQRSNGILDMPELHGTVLEGELLNGDPSPIPQVIVVGVATEVVVGIALASFVMGAGLTAILWCIHMRTDPYRRVNQGKTKPATGSAAALRSNSLSVSQQQQQSQQPTSGRTQQQQHQQGQEYQYSYDYEVSSRSNSSSSNVGGSPIPNARTPMNPAA